MKKNGFTLAEVLLTMGIVGTVAALVLPTVIQNVSTSQVTPKLNKAISMFEQANQAMLNSYNSDSLSDAGLLDSVEAYTDALSNNIKISPAVSEAYGTPSTDLFIGKDNIGYSFEITNRNNCSNLLILFKRQNIDNRQPFCLSSTFWEIIHI